MDEFRKTTIVDAIPFAIASEEGNLEAWLEKLRLYDLLNSGYAISFKKVKRDPGWVVEFTATPQPEQATLDGRLV